MTSLALQAGLAFLAGLVLVPIVRAAARRLGIVAAPHANRWHSRPTPLLGGVAIALIVIIGGWMVQPTSAVALTLVCATLAAGLGLIDDVHALKSSTKLVFQIVIASIFLYSGHRLEWTSSITVDTMLTLAWIVGITNALNLLDNMDGLASGVGVIACLSLLMTTGDLQTPSPESQLVALLLGALAAFLVYNIHPASIFMGDTGSLLTGMLLALAGVSHQGQASGTGELLSVVAAPVLVLFIPIFDTTLVVVSRLLSGRRPSEGGRDHSSHRMVAMGLTEPSAVGVLWVLAAVGGIAGVSVQRLELEWAGPIVAAFVVAMALFAAYLVGVRVHEGVDTEPRGITPVVIAFMHKRRVLEVLLDVALASVTFYCAHRLRFDQPEFERAFPGFVRSLPVIIACQIPVLLILDAYRGMWRYFGLMDAVVFGKSIVLGTVAGAAVVALLNGVLPAPPAVYVIHAALLFIAMTGSRASFLLLTEFFRRRSARHLRAVVFETDADEMATHRLALHSSDYRVLGFFFDSPDGGPRSVEGYPQLGDYGTLLAFIAKGLTDVVIVSAHQLDGDRLEELAGHCGVNGVALVTLRYALEPVDATRVAAAVAPRAAEPL